ncbi:hypothetical protein, partial [Rubrimonas sp.]|uniref:hypothetical protein n=1 Tax=Rubrimonas sp. TaxID=2036015 RepID=UPI002FDEF0E2
AATPRVGVLSCGYRRIDAEGRVLETVAAVSGPARLRLHLMFANPILHPGAMIRAPLLRAHGGYAEDWRLSQDLELWARLAPHTRFDNIAAPLMDWRRHGAASMATRDADAWSRAGAVHRALLEAYLGASVEGEAAACAALLFWGRKALSLEQARAGDAVLRAVARRAALREPPGAQLFLRARAAVALARSAAAAEPSAARAMRLMALRWRPGPTAIRAVLADLLRRAP